jgi:hypothetical protein
MRALVRAKSPTLATNPDGTGTVYTALDALPQAMFAREKASTVVLRVCRMTSSIERPISKEATTQSPRE